MEINTPCPLCQSETCIGYWCMFDNVDWLAIEIAYLNAELEEIEIEEYEDDWEANYREEDYFDEFLDNEPVEDMLMKWMCAEAEEEEEFEILIEREEELIRQLQQEADGE